MSELAFNVNGNAFDVPATVSAWRVRRLKPRGASELVSQLHAGGVTVTPSNDGEHAAGGTMIAQAAISNSVEESLVLQNFEVPRVGIEPTTRGFSVPVPRLPKVATQRAKSPIDC